MHEVGSTERRHSVAKLATIVAELVRQGASIPDVLTGTDVAPADLHSHKTLVSQEQILTGCRNALRLSRDAHLPYRIGSALHVSAYGMYGYAILCSTNFREVMDFVIRYHLLAAPLASIEFAERDNQGIWTIEAIHSRNLDDRLYRFIIEMQVGLQTSLHRDVMGQAFRPREIWLSYEKMGDFHLAEELTSCPVRWNQDRNQIRFDSKVLDDVPLLGNLTTYSGVINLCDALLAEMTAYNGIVGQTRKILVHGIRQTPTLENVAAQLGMTSRTMRRRLSDQGTSFRSILDETRSELAIKYLRETSMTNEDIAVALGFSDPANFRRAFRRWMNKSPIEYRKR